MTADRYRLRRDPSRTPEQVANARADRVDLRPVSEAPARAVQDAWRAWLPGQPTPLPWED